MSYVKLENLGKKYPNSDELSVADFNLDIEQGEFIVFVGPSGCGKSTTLRMIAGLEEITEGDLSIEGVNVNKMHPKERDIAMVFQNYALYPHMDVYKNIAFGLKLQKVPEAEIKEKIDWAADVLGLTDYLNRKPKDLSGGQRQRVALGRAIVRNPKVFLMDEPLSNLDAKLRVTMRNEITKLHRKLGATTIYVTHDQVEAMTMADRIVCMSKGEVQQIGSPLELYNKPANLFVATFIGAPQMNIFEAKVSGTTLEVPSLGTIALPEGVVKSIDNLEGRNLKIGVRPEHLKIEPLALSTYANQVAKARIENIEMMGSENFIYATAQSHKFIIKSSYIYDGLQIDGDVEFVMDANKIHFFDADTGERLGE